MTNLEMLKLNFSKCTNSDVAPLGTNVLEPRMLTER